MVDSYAHPGEAPRPDMDGALGLAQWARLADELLGGLVHSLNNRVSALSICAELGAMGDRDAFSDGILSTEMTRLQRLGVLIGLLVARRPDAEALELDPVVDDAVALYANHPRARGLRCVVIRRGTGQPVRAPRWALVRAILLLLEAATAGLPAQGGGQVDLVLDGDDDAVRVRVASPGTAGPYGEQVAALCGGTIGREEGELVLTLPSLLALRRNERAERADRAPR